LLLLLNTYGDHIGGIRALQWVHSGGSTSQVPEGGSRSKVLSRTYHGIKDNHRCIRRRIHHRAYADPSFHSIQEGRGQWHVGAIRTLTSGSTHG
jgi:hypothetical protein